MKKSVVAGSNWSAFKKQKIVQKTDENRDKNDSPLLRNASSKSYSNASYGNYQKSGGNFNDGNENDKTILKNAKVMDKLQKEERNLSFEEKSMYVALDCEMVGLGDDGKFSALARACVVDYEGEVIYDR